jgi:hypothetical protein
MYRITKICISIIQLFQKKAEMVSKNKQMSRWKTNCNLIDFESHPVVLNVNKLSTMIKRQNVKRTQFNESKRRKESSCGYININKIDCKARSVLGKGNIS